MKQSTINDAEPVDKLHKSTLPRISYGRAMGSYFLTTSGAIRSVELATAAEFLAFLATCTLPARHGKAARACNLALAGLQYEEPLSKWFAICELLQAGAHIPLYSTREAAAAANTERTHS